MKTLIHEIGVIDKYGNKHPVKFNSGLNVVTGKSSTGKSALIEIFDYCFGSRENTVPKGVITDNAAIYYVALAVNDQNILIARNPDISGRVFCRKLESFDSGKIQYDYFHSSYFSPLDDFKKCLREFFIDINDVDVSLEARANRKNNSKAPTPSVRSFMSFILQHQNLVANKHALFYRFDEKEKRDQVIKHTKIFLGLVDQNYFLMSQEQERLNGEMNRLKRQQEANKRAKNAYKEKVGPILNILYAMMGFKDEPLSAVTILANPQSAKDELDGIIIPEKIVHNSNALTQKYTQLKQDLTIYTAELRKIQREEASINKHIKEEDEFVNNLAQLDVPDHIHISTTVCPFCHTERDDLQQSAEKLQQAIIKVSDNFSQTRPMKAKFESLLLNKQREIGELGKKITTISEQVIQIEKTEEQLAKHKSLYENIIMEKAKLFTLLDTLSFANDIELDKEIAILNQQINTINHNLSLYDIKSSLKKAEDSVNKYMMDIGSNFDFEASYKPINLKFSFESFELYHLTPKPKEEKIYLRSMGSGANWLYSHITLFLALHQYFAGLSDKCSIPSVIFFDQPTQVYFPNFKRDYSESFDEQKNEERELEKKSTRNLDDDIKSVENLFSQLSIYCRSIEKSNGFSPQIIVTDHADGLTLSNGVLFESLVNGNRWRTRGLIDN